MYVYVVIVVSLVSSVIHQQSLNVSSDVAH